ncbi:hypothetical protein [Amycolatopsis tucumanensis]|uniref:hypothetical protein n=1 Tax=Amycolatopsis tucumanensis TaxID=401106 RepID=UPI001F333637|nr:hypothetical protein [Amycolatopsis tucumanensis]MCF6428968.1 hypothetical protein [Amycolatopsis tucumanensis]
MPEAVVIGGGQAGLAAAHALLARGVRPLGTAPCPACPSPATPAGVQHGAGEAVQPG